MITKKQISECFSEWFNYFKGLEKEKKVKYFLELMLIIVSLSAAYYIFNINIGNTQTIQNNSSNNQITIQNSNLTNSPIIQNSPNVSFVYNNLGTNAETFSNQQSKTIFVTVLANTITGQTAHNLGFIPKVGRPNPDSEYGIFAYATSDITNVTVTMVAAQPVDVNFSVPISLI